MRLQAVGLVILIAAVGHAQQNADAVTIEAASARYVLAHQMVSGRVILDTSNALLRGTSLRARRTATETADLARSLGAEVGDLSDYRICATTNLNTCLIRGADAVVSVGTPVIQGDSAVIALRIFHNYTLPTGEQGLTSRSARLQLGRQGSNWTVIRILPGSSIT